MSALLTEIASRASTLWARLSSPIDSASAYLAFLGFVALAFAFFVVAIHTDAQRHGDGSERVSSALDAELRRPVMGALLVVFWALLLIVGAAAGLFWVTRP